MARFTPFLAGLLLLAACDSETRDTAVPNIGADTALTDADIDADGDGVVAALDCDDADPSVSPGEPEQCDGIDNDCDGMVDEGYAMQDWYDDLDGDGYGGTEVAAVSCGDPSGTLVSSSGDCDDEDPYTFPGAEEVCDEVDNDCDKLIDAEDPEMADVFIWYADVDGDGYGDIDNTSTACDMPSGYTDNAEDCLDDDPLVHPDGDEVCNGIDDDCSGEAEADEECECAMRRYNNLLYAFCDQKVPWADALTSCEDMSMSLATINNADENLWATNTAMDVAIGGWWIGLNDRATEGSWVWSSGQTDGYTAWNAGEPNNSGDEDCTAIRSSGDASWNDSSCTNSKRFICEAEPAK